MRVPDIRKVYIVITDMSTGVLNEIPIAVVPIAGHVLAGKTEEFFSGREPCRSCASAVAARLYDEVLEALAAEGGGRLILNKGFREWLDVGEGMTAVAAVVRA